MLHVDESQNETEIVLQPGENLEIQLNENPTTGFRWALESVGAPACILVEDSYENSTVMPGAGGSHRWQFQAKQIGEGRIELRYRRAWEGQGAGTRIFSLRVRVA
jgi:inhibitor of cysteine peptidase